MVSSPATQAAFGRRRHQPRKPPLSKIRERLRHDAQEWPLVSIIRLIDDGSECNFLDHAASKE